jgi:hypothetical protein
MTNLAPILIFVYNRPEHTLRLIESLVNCELSKDSDLFVFIDAPKPDATNIDKNLQVEKIVRNITHFKSVTIYKNEVNKGVDKSIMDGVSKIINIYGKVIVLEDDLIVGLDFLRFFNWALSSYEEDLRIYSVNGFMFPVDFDKNTVVLLPTISSWGWGTWKNRWKKFEFEEKNRNIIVKNTELSNRFNLPGIDYAKMLIENKECWDINWYFYVFKNNGLNIYPSKTLVKNSGFDGSGVHCPNVNFFQDFDKNTKIDFLKSLTIDLEFYDFFLNYFTNRNKDKLFHEKLNNLIKLKWL